jgi:hypothetical protein
MWALTSYEVFWIHMNFGLKIFIVVSCGKYSTNLTHKWKFQVTSCVNLSCMLVHTVLDTTTTVQHMLIFKWNVWRIFLSLIIRFNIMKSQISYINNNTHNQISLLQNALNRTVTWQRKEQEACVQHTQGRQSLLAWGGYPQNTENASEIVFSKLSPTSFPEASHYSGITSHFHTSVSCKYVTIYNYI